MVFFPGEKKTATGAHIQVVALYTQKRMWDEREFLHSWHGIAMVANAVEDMRKYLMKSGTSGLNYARSDEFFE